MTDSAPGWDAIDQAFSQLYPQREPLLFEGLAMRMRDDPIEQVAAWPADGFWHLVTYGMTELFEKQSSLADQSGWGYEFVIRAPRDDHDTRPPAWALDALRGLARYVERSGQSIAEGHWLAYDDGFIAGSDLVAGVFVRDPAFPNVMQTPFGRMSYRLVIGITRDEQAFRAAHGTRALVEHLVRYDPRLLTAPGRETRVAAPPAARIETLHSISIAVLRVTRSFTGTHEIELGRDGCDALVAALANGLTSGEIHVSSALAKVAIHRGDTCSWKRDDDGGVVVLTADAARSLASALKRNEGAIAVDEIPDLKFRVVDR